MKQYALIHVAPDEDGQTVVTADGILLGPAEKVIEFIVRGAISCEQAKATLPDWIESARKAFQSTR